MQEKRKVRKFSRVGRIQQLRSLELRKNIRNEIKELMINEPGISREQLFQRIGHDTNIVGICYASLRKELCPKKQ